LVKFHHENPEKQRRPVFNDEDSDEEMKGGGDFFPTHGKNLK